MPRPRKPASPFRYFNSSPEVIRLVVMMYVRFPLSLRNVEDLRFACGFAICHETHATSSPFAARPLGKGDHSFHKPPQSKTI